MGNNNKKIKDPRKGVSGGSFLLIMLAVILTFFTMQNMGSDKSTKVAFSHQAEHLVNLDLLQPDLSRKIALNDHLVTFSGKFKNDISDEARAHYRYLELLNVQHELTAEKQLLEKGLAELKQHVADSADWFLHLSGLSVPNKGYVVVSSVYDTPDRDNAIVIKSLSDKQILSLDVLQQKLDTIYFNPSDFNQELIALLQGFRSPTLGIGNETMKQQLKDLEGKLSQASKSAIQDKKKLFEEVLGQMQLLVGQLNQEQDSVRLAHLRSVRSYKQDLQRYVTVSQELTKNSALLEKARHGVSDFVWFFNNQEIL